MTASAKLAWAMSFCQRARLRLTDSRENILRFLSEHRLPVSIEMMMRSQSFTVDCAETTVYRTLMLFREADLVRQINLPGKTSYFVLNVPGEASDFLVCRSCGRMQELSPLKSVSKLEQDVASRSGFSDLYHELELYGICPDCQTGRRNTAPTTKLSNLKRPVNPCAEAQ
jgi:Fur family transcriptional regulator, ferric uptake regulator